MTRTDTSDGFVTMVRCPFCRTGRGAVAVDPTGIIDPARPGRVQTLPVGVDYLIIDPGFPPAGLCPHLVQLGASAQWEGLEESRDVVIRHPGLEAVDPSERLTDFVWSEGWAATGRERAPREDFAFATQYELVTGDHEDTHQRCDGGSHCRWWACVDALYAVDAVGFIEEVRLMHARGRG